MQHKGVKEELTACNLAVDGSAAICKQRLCRYLTVSNSPIYMTDSPERQLSETAPITNNCTSPSEFHFTSSLPNAKDFLKPTAPTTQPKSKPKRKRESENNFQGIETYIKSLDDATSTEISKDLEFLKLNSDGGLKARKKRITQHIRGSTAISSCSSEQLSLINNRLGVIEKSNISISTLLGDIQKDMGELKLTKTPEPKSTGKHKNSAACADGADLLKNLTKANQDTSLLLEKSKNNLEGLTQALINTATVKRDLEAWHESIFKSEDSNRINQILTILTASKSTDRSFSPDSRHETRQDHGIHVPRSPSETRTNRDVPGLPPDEQERQSYRRQRKNNSEITARERKPSHGRSKRSAKPSVRKKQKVVLLCDSTMRGFKSEEFSKRYDVSNIYRRSWDELGSCLSATAEEISNHNPDAVYIHLGTRDTISGQTDNSLINTFVQCTEKILRETSQQCKVFISHPIVCNQSDGRGLRFGRLMSDAINELKRDRDKADFWMRTRENKNSNFYPEESELPHNYMLTSNQSHLNDRGIRVIMGNFRTSLNSIFKVSR
jgi:hypothetical protein